MAGRARPYLVLGVVSDVSLVRMRPLSSHIIVKKRTERTRLCPADLVVGPVLMITIVRLLVLYPESGGHDALNESGHVAPCTEFERAISGAGL